MLWAMIAVACSMTSCAGLDHESSHSISDAGLNVEAERPIEFPGLRNVVSFHEGFISGAAPEDGVGFQSLDELGVRTIISVDGAVPLVDQAESRGMRYIHLPVGYGGFDRSRSLELAYAIRESILDGPVYVHCHYGKHRSAAVAGAVTVMLGWQSADEAIVKMEVAGTSPSYKGLYACVADSVPLEKGELDDRVFEFDSVWEPSSFTSGMTEMAKCLDRLRRIEQAGWRTPVDHPDLVPVAEAGRLTDLHRVLASDDHLMERADEFHRLLHVGHDASGDLERQLLGHDPDHGMLSRQLNLIAASCTSCHDVYRVDRGLASAE